MSQLHSRRSQQSHCGSHLAFRPKHTHFHQQSQLHHMLYIPPLVLHPARNLSWHHIPLQTPAIASAQPSKTPVTQFVSLKQTRIYYMHDKAASMSESMLMSHCHCLPALLVCTLYTADNVTAKTCPIIETCRRCNTSSPTHGSLQIMSMEAVVPSNTQCHYAVQVHNVLPLYHMLCITSQERP